MCLLAQMLEEVQAGMVNGVKHGTLRSPGMIQSVPIPISVMYRFLMSSSSTFLFHSY